MIVLRYNKSLYRIVKDIHELISSDATRDNAFSKCYMIASLAQILDLRHYVKIGFCKSESLFAVAVPFLLAGGTATGVGTGIASSTSDELKNQIGYGDSFQIFEDSAMDVASKLCLMNSQVDMLHISCGSEFSKGDYDAFFPLLSDNSIIVFENIDSPDIESIYSYSKQNNLLVYENTGDDICRFSVLLKADRTPENEYSARSLGMQLATVPKKLGTLDSKPVVSVGVLAYNHVDYIDECLKQIFAQHGNFSLKIRILDNCSDDNTVGMIELMLAKSNPCAVIDVELIENTENVDTSQNLKKLLSLLDSGEFFAVCKGDEFWCNRNRVKTHIAFLEANDNIAFSFNLTKFLNKPVEDVCDFFTHELTDGCYLSTTDLVRFNSIGSWSASFYRTDFLKETIRLYKEKMLSEWMFNIAYSEFADFGFIAKPMSICRSHPIYSILESDEMDNVSLLLQQINEYDMQTEYRYTADFQKHKEALYRLIKSKNPLHHELTHDIIIVGNLFPHPLSPFIKQEYTSLLRVFDDLRVISFEDKGLLLGGNRDDYVQMYKLTHPDIAHKLRVLNEFDHVAINMDSSEHASYGLFYTTFLYAIYDFLQHLECASIPFVFTLYPGGGFFIDNVESDAKLEKVMRSEMFRGVIVTQQNVYNYLINKNFCDVSKIHFIYGVVTPFSSIDRVVNKRFLASEKNYADICFIAHKYSLYGWDKGYDTFIRVAEALSKMYLDIRFHIIGGFDENDIKTENISNIVFHGKLTTEKMHDLFVDMDIVISPNVPDVLCEGAFDGFPTASVTEAGLSKVAMFCTDELGLNNGRFRDGEDIIIIKPDVEQIVSCVEYYISNPELLKSISEAGYRKCNMLYSYDAQILPRIKILRDVLETERSSRIARFVEIVKAVADERKTSENKRIEDELNRRECAKSRQHEHDNAMRLCRINLSCGYTKSLYRIVQDINSSIPSDNLGGSPFSKVYIMACLAQLLNLKHYVEIGVYRGKSLFSVAAQFVLAGGTAVGIDPYLQEAAFEHDIEEDLHHIVNSLISDTNFDSIYNEVLTTRDSLGYGESIEIIRDLSSNAVSELRARNSQIDMLHIDGNHDTKHVKSDYELYYPLLSDDAIIVFDDINWPSVDVIYQRAKRENIFVFEGEVGGVISYGILLKSSKDTKNELKARRLANQLNAVETKLATLDNYPTVSVGVLSYKHGAFITDTLENVFNQQGNFSMKVRVCDDCSPDDSVNKITEAFSSIDPCALIDAELFASDINIGMVQNFKKLTYMMDKGDYFTFCEGDDYWSDKERIQTHINFLEEERNKTLAFSFNAMKLLHQETGDVTDHIEQQFLLEGPYSTSALANRNVIGNLGVAFYRAVFLEKLNPSLFSETFCGDWMFNIAYSEFGNFAFINKAMSVYRVHSGGIWSSNRAVDINTQLLSIIKDYDRYTNYKYTDDFQSMRELAISVIESINPSHHIVSHDIIIADTVFPNPAVGFRIKEYTLLMEKFERLQVISFLDEENLVLGGKRRDILRDYKRANPHVAHKLRALPLLKHNDISLNLNIDILANVNAKVFYTAYLSNMDLFLEHIEKARIPFVFTLHAGGGYYINTDESDRMLQRVLSSDYFFGVIVTEQTDYEYLLSKNYCKADKVYFNAHEVVKKRFLTDAKSSVEICFTAHNSSSMENDSNLLMFMEIAEALGKTRENILFHVVGDFDEQSYSGLGVKNIFFHGKLSHDELHLLYENIDLVISPRTPYELLEGGIEEFPPRVVVSAGFSKVAMFCTDELDINNGRFRDGEDIVIMNPDNDHIKSCITYYIDNPDKLKNISNNGYIKCVELYGYNTKLPPSVDVLSRLISTSPIVRTYDDGTYLRAHDENGTIIPVMHCFDNNYVIPAAVSFYSMLQHANPAHIYRLYVLHSDITWQNQQLLVKLVASFSNASLEFIDMANQFTDIWENSWFTGTSHYSKELLYKLIAPSIFPQYEKLIITDVDVVYEGDISLSYFSFDASEKIYLAGVKHVCPRGSELETYYSKYETLHGKGVLDKLKVCAGYLVYNLQKMREDRMEDRFIKFFKENMSNLMQPEQDVLNFCTELNEVVMLPLNYVTCTYKYDFFPNEDSYSTDAHYTAEEISDALNNPIQLHYATPTKPWNNPACTKAGKWFSVLRQTGLYENYLRSSKKLNVDSLTPHDIWEDYAEPNFPVTVSILCCTYNHIRFIRTTLEHLVTQKTNYSFEIIVSDDASNDGTQAVIEEYTQKYPSLFKKCILRKKNVGIGENYYEALKLVEGKYLAICDGDDYWISPNKLHMQVDFLEKKPECSIVCSSFVSHSVDSNKSDSVFDVNLYIRSSRKIKEDGYDYEDLLYCRFIASCTVMMRWKLHNRVPEFIKHFSVIDFQLTLIHSAFGKTFVINEPVLAQYNTSEKGIYRSSQAQMTSEQQNIIREVNQYLNYSYNKATIEYLSMVKAKPITVASISKRERLKWVYMNIVPPFMQKIYVRHKEKRLKAVNDKSVSKARIYADIVYRECAPELIKNLYRRYIRRRNR